MFIQAKSSRPHPSTSLIQRVQAELDSTEHVAKEIMLGWKADTVSALSDYGVQLLERFDFPEQEMEILHLKLAPGQDLAETIAKLRKSEAVSFAESNQIIHLDQPSVSAYRGPSTRPDDLTEDLWGLHNTGQYGGLPGADIKALEAWTTTSGDRSQSGPIIAIHDTGMDMEHPDLVNNLWTNPGEIPDNGLDDDNNGVIDDVHGFNAIDGSGSPVDGNRHGTHVAGTIGAVGNNGQGISGVMQEARLMPVKIFTDEGQTSSDIIVRALQYSAKMGARITNNSFGARPSQAIHQAFKQHPALHVVASGNRNQNNDRVDVFPANYELPNLLSVAATDRHDQKARFSNFGPSSVDVAAPGADIWSTFPGGGYTSMSGTSMSAPHVSGGAGLLLSAYPNLSATQLKDRLIYSSDRKEELANVSLSGGRINVAEALEDDLMAPHSPTSFRADDVSSHGATLRWTVPPEDGDQGGAVSAVELRVSDREINPKNYTQAQRFASVGGQQVGQQAQVIYAGIPQTKERVVYFASQAVDNVGNRSAITLSSALLPAASLDFEDEFEIGRSSFEKSGNFHFTTDPACQTVASSAVPPGKERSPVSLLTSPILDLEGKKNSFLKFRAETDLFWENQAVVEVRGQDERWKKVFDFETSQEWAEHGIDLSEFDDQSIRFRFKVTSRWGEPRQDLTLDRVELLVESNDV